MRREGRSLSAVLSFGQGIIHSHYTVALAPAIGALVGVGSVELWRRRDDRPARALLAGTLAVTAVWAWMLLTRTPDFAPWLRVAVFIVGLAAAGGLFVESQLPRSRLGAAVAGATLLAGLAGPAAYALDTAASPPSAGLGSDSFRDGVRLARDGSDGVVPFDGGPGQDGSGALPASGRPLSVRSEADGNPQDDIDGLLNGSTPGTLLVTLLQADAGHHTWVAAAIGSTRAASYQLATGEPVMPVGGFNGSDPSPTLEQFQHHVALGEIHYLIGGGGFGRQNGGADTSRQIAAWVMQHFTARTIDGVTIYDLTAVAP
jgi:hypothetical protein